MASSVATVRGALRALLQAHLPKHSVHAHTPDNPEARAAWIWIGDVDYSDDMSAGGGYRIAAAVTIQEPYPSSVDAQRALDRYLTPSTGLSGWIDADTTLGGAVRRADVDDARVQLSEVTDQGAAAVVIYAVVIYV